jgi:hypothetical protein
MTKYYRLPDGNTTTSYDGWIGAWNSLIEPLESLTGLTHFAFDPNVAFTTKSGETVTLPVWLLQRINRGLERKGN